MSSYTKHFIDEAKIVLQLALARKVAFNENDGNKKSLKYIEAEQVLYNYLVKMDTSELKYLEYFIHNGSNVEKTANDFDISLISEIFKTPIEPSIPIRYSRNDIIRVNHIMKQENLHIYLNAAIKNF
ncbi:hypothetical protein PB01_08255 [Psychrobacillus glaciei]|uniref:Uncharacterized protein n=1 Tax=Psychrobacillus glaciei TaxID=2283160 RepID=A0A5J6SLM7_9BACI|nr:hypothetical protein [Psychrobacillus glaciei]QFF98825.1 hypothetical protein PB01_08255 [Psychrobacillus glaciei]